MTLSRRQFLKGIILKTSGVLVGSSIIGKQPMSLYARTQEKKQSKRPNILFIVIDDLNSDVGFLNKDSGLTPNMDRLAKTSTIFNKAYCPAPICNPSRTSFLTGKYPHKTGIYGLEPNFWEVPKLSGLKSIPQHFRENGYYSAGVGKIFHAEPHKESFDKFGGWFDGYGPVPDKPIHLDPNLGTHPYFDWGKFLEEKETTDFRVAETACGFLEQAKDYKKPFFISVGIFRPHAPLYAPQEWFEKHPLEDIPRMKDQGSDLDDISPYALKLVNHHKRLKYNRWLHENDYTRSFLQAYRACVSFADNCVGMVLDKLVQLGLADNTIIVITGDHGMQNGAKQIWYKRTLWEATARVPMLIKVPGKAARRVDTPVGQIDLFPTLCDLTKLPKPEGLDGSSLKRLISGKKEDRRPVLTTHGPGNHSLRNLHYRYIRYADGSEELYDHRTDPLERVNLFKTKKIVKLKDIVQEFQSCLPESSAPFAPGTSGFWSDAFPGM
jgi:arylsulfatase A-like enzyme